MSEETLTYRSVLPAIAVEFQDNTFLDVDDIVGFTLSRTDDNLPMGVAIVDVRFGKRSWHSIKAITINGQYGRLVSFDRFGHPFEMFDHEDDEDERTEEPFDYAKLVVKYELPEAEMNDIMLRRIDMMEIEYEPEEEEDENKDPSTVLQCSGDSAASD